MSSEQTPSGHLTGTDHRITEHACNTCKGLCPIWEFASGFFMCPKCRTYQKGMFNPMTRGWNCPAGLIYFAPKNDDDDDKLAQPSPSEKVALTQERVHMFREFKTFIAEHRDIIFTVILLAIADRFLLNGALSAKLTALAHKITDKASARVDAPSSTATV